MIHINQPIIGEEERREVDSVLKTANLTTGAREGGPKVKEFENALATFLGAKHAVAVNSGTSALYASLLAAGVKPNDKVLVPSFTFIATANAVLMTGARPLFVDIGDDYNMDPADLKRKIDKNCKAIIPVHLYGYPARIDEINEIAEKHRLSVIEDACQSLGATFMGKQTGTLGLAGCFSFYPSKVITCGEGGAVATNDDAIYENLLMTRNHGMVRGYDSRILGANLRMPEMEAAIARVQLGRLTDFIAARRRNARTLSQMLDGGEGYRLPEERDGVVSNWYLYTVAVTDHRDKIVDVLHSKQVGAAVYYSTPVNRTPLYAGMGYSNEPLSKTHWAADHVISIPVHPKVSESDVELIAGAFKDATKMKIRSH